MNLKLMKEYTPQFCTANVFSQTYFLILVWLKVCFVSSESVLILTCLCDKTQTLTKSNLREARIYSLLSFQITDHHGETQARRSNAKYREVMLPGSCSAVFLWCSDPPAYRWCTSWWTGTFHINRDNLSNMFIGKSRAFVHLRCPLPCKTRLLSSWQ